MRLLSSPSDTAHATNGSHGSHLNASLANTTDAHAASGHHLFPLTHHPALLLMMFVSELFRSEIPEPEAPTMLSPVIIDIDTLSNLIPSIVPG